MSDLPAPTALTPAEALASTGRGARRGRPKALPDDALRSVVLACRVDPATAEAFTARADAHGQERATLLARLVAEELARPAPRRRGPRRPSVDVSALVAALRQIEDERGELREGHGALVRLARLSREGGDSQTHQHAEAVLARVDRAVERLDTLTEQVVTVIERASGGSRD